MSGWTEDGLHPTKWVTAQYVSVALSLLADLDACSRGLYGARQQVTASKAAVEGAEGRLSLAEAQRSGGGSAAAAGTSGAAQPKEGDPGMVYGRLAR